MSVTGTGTRPLNLTLPRDVGGTEQTLTNTGIPGTAATQSLAVQRAQDMFGAGGAPLNLGATARTPDAPLTAAQQSWMGSINTFQDKVTGALNLNAQGLAAGTFPQTGADITPDQRKQLQGAAKDLFMDMPVSMLAPGLQQTLRDRGANVTDTTKLKDLGSVGGDMAKDLANRFKHETPAAYYGLAATGAVAAGVYGYTQGSAAIEKLGIKPEFKTKIFDDAVTVRAKGAWDAKMSNPNLTVGADGSFKVNQATVSYGGSVKVGGENFGSMGVQSADARLAVQTDNWGAGANVTMGERGSLSSFGLNGNYTTQSGMRLSGAAAFDGDARLQSLTGGVQYNRDAFSLSGSMHHDFTTDRTTGSLSAGYRPSRDFEIAVQGSLDTKGESRIGVGATWRF